MVFDVLLWPPYVIGGPLYFCPVIPVFYFLSIFYLFSSPNLRLGEEKKEEEERNHRAKI